MLRPELHDEKDLLLQVAEGNPTAFSQLFEKYHPLLGHHIYRLTANRELTEEVVQDVFLKIWMTRETLTEVTNFRAWLYTVSKNHALNALRQMARQRLRYKEWQKDMKSHTEVEEPEKEWMGIIDNAIEQLPPQQKKVYSLSRIEGMNYQEIADSLHLSHETVKYYMKLALASIAKYVKEKAGLAVILLAFFSH